MEKFTKTFNLGKVAYNGKRRINSASVTIEWRFTKNGGESAYYWEFSASGEIYNATRSDMVNGGQNLDTLARLVHGNCEFREVYALWKEYHANGMTAGSPAQEAAKRDFKFDPERVTWYWYDSDDITDNTDRFGRHSTDDEEEAKKAAARGLFVTAEKGDRLAQIDIFLARRGLYTDHGYIYKGAPYKYSSAWLISEVPEADRERIRALLGITRADEERVESEVLKASAA